MPLYTPFGFTEGTITEGNDNRLSTAQVINVKKNPGNGEFSSIATAVAYIVSLGDAGPSKYYVIKIGPGTYTEPEIIVPSYVFIQGTDIETTIVQPNTNNHNVFSMSAVSGLSFLSITGSGIGYSGVSCVNVGYYVLLHKVDLYSLDIGITANATTTESFLFLEYVSVEDFTTNALKITAVGAINHCSNENFYTDSTNAVGVSAVDISGIGVLFTMFAATMTGNAALGNDIGITFSNGATGTVENISISGFHTGFYVPNTDPAPGLVLSSVTLYNSNSNISILHPSTTGSLNISTDKTKVNILATTLSVSIFDVLGQGLTLTDGLHQGTTFDQATNIVAVLQQQSSSGVISGGVVSSVGFVVSVTAGTGYLSIGTHPNDYLKFVSWVTQSTTIDANSEIYLYIDNTGTLQKSLSVMDIIQNINLAEVVSDASSVYLIEQINVDATHIGTRNFTFLQEAIGSIVANGLLVTKNVTPGRLNISSGCYFFTTKEFCPSGGTAVTFIPYYRNGSGGYIKGANTKDVSSGPSTWQYDNNDGYLVNIPTDEFAKHSLYLVGEGVSEKYLFVYAQTSYATLIEAEAANLPTTPAFFDNNIVLIASIIVGQGQVNIAEIRDERPVIGFKTSGISATAYHGNLLNLLDDDHKQYLLVDGSRFMSGDLTLDNNKSLILKETTGNGTDSITLKAPASVTTSYTINLPVVQGMANQTFINDGAGNLSWGTSGSGTVNSGTTGDIAYYASSTTAVSTGGTASVKAGALTLSNVINQIVLGTTNTLTITSTQASSQTLTIPTITTGDIVVTTGLVQSITGVKTMTNMTTLAGTLTVPSMTITNGQLLTTQTANVIENDGVAFYNTVNTTNGRCYSDAYNIFRLTVPGTGITTIADFFGANDGIPLVAAGVYDIEWHCYFAHATTNGAATWTIVNTQAPVNMVAEYIGSPTGGIDSIGTSQIAGVVGITVASQTLPATGNLTKLMNHLYIIHAVIESHATINSNVRLRLTMSAGTATPLRDSYFIVRRLSTGNTGTFVA